MKEQIITVLSDYKTYISLTIFIIGIFLKILLDLNLGIFFIKTFYWISLRGIFRIKSNKISGIYKQHWTLNNNKKYSKISDRQSLITLKQLNNYCYGKFVSKEDTYYLFGEIIDRKIIGHWADIDSKLGYFGSFELTIIDKRRIEGVWIGHSNEEPNNINIYQWKFRAVTPNTKFLVPIQISIFFKNIYIKYFRTMLHKFF